MIYYSALRPIGIGCCPKSGIVSITNFDRRKYVPEIDREAWGYVEYDHELTEKEAYSYDLVKGESK